MDFFLRTAKFSMIYILNICGFQLSIYSCRYLSMLTCTHIRYLHAYRSKYIQNIHAGEYVCIHIFIVHDYNQKQIRTSYFVTPSQAPARETVLSFFMFLHHSKDGRTAFVPRFSGLPSVFALERTSPQAIRVAVLIWKKCSKRLQVPSMGRSLFCGSE